MRSGDLLAYFSRNCLSNGIVSVPDTILFKFSPEIPFLSSSTRVLLTDQRETDGRTDGQAHPLIELRERI